MYVCIICVYIYTYIHVYTLSIYLCIHIFIYFLCFASAITKIFHSFDKCTCLMIFDWFKTIYRNLYELVHSLNVSLYNGGILAQYTENTHGFHAVYSLGAHNLCTKYGIQAKWFLQRIRLHVFFINRSSVCFPF